MREADAGQDKAGPSASATGGFYAAHGKDEPHDGDQHAQHGDEPDEEGENAEVEAGGGAEGGVVREV